MSTFVSILLIIIIVGIQYFMASRKNPIWGVIIPVIYTIAMIYLYAINYYNSFLSFILFFALGLIFLIEEWNRGRKDRKKKEKYELNKMRKRFIKKWRKPHTSLHFYLKTYLQPNAFSIHSLICSYVAPDLSHSQTFPT